MSNFGIGLSAIQVATKVLDMVSHNVANIETPDYKRLDEHNSEVMYGNQPGGVRTQIVRSGDVFMENRMNYAMGDAAESAAFKEGMDKLGNISTATVEASFSSFMNASQDLNVNPNDTSRQIAFKEAGQNFSTQLAQLGDQFTTVSQDITMKRDYTQIELTELQKQMSQLTAGPITDESKAELESLAKQVMMKTRSIDGYNKVLQGVIPPITAMYIKSRNSTVDGVNASYGQNIVDTTGGFTFDPTNLGDVKKLTEFGSQQFNKDMGALQTTLGAKMNAADSMDTLYQNILNGVKAEYQSQTGVDLTEQLLKAKRYQNMYEGALKVIQTQDAMIGSLLNIMG